ncbi:MAG: cytochrome c [Nitrospira sp.]|nr:MAG: cytochrome c [Nitrospira sp.]
MGYLAKCVGLMAAIMVVGATAVMAGEELDPLKPRVPKDKIAEVKKMKNPVAPTPENIAKGKAMFESKGTCYTCHGPEGNGKGPAAVILNPTPRDFTNCKFHKKRTDGELMYVLKNGSNGPNDSPKPTGMVPLVPGTISEEEGWTIINYERTFCKGGAKKN